MKNSSENNRLAELILDIWENPKDCENSIGKAHGKELWWLAYEVLYNEAEKQIKEIARDIYCEKDD